MDNQAITMIILLVLVGLWILEIFSALFKVKEETVSIRYLSPRG
jgi:hypothetical protein